MKQQIYIYIYMYMYRTPNWCIETRTADTCIGHVLYAALVFYGHALNIPCLAAHPVRRPRHAGAANLRTKILDFRGLDSSRILV